MSCISFKNNYTGIVIESSRAGGNTLDGGGQGSCAESISYVMMAGVEVIVAVGENGQWMMIRKD